MKYLMFFSYDGSKFNGFQRQKNVRSVQGDIEKKLSSFFSEPCVIKGAGRTDRSVHACNQAAHFITEKNIKGLKKFLNNELEYIKVKKIKIVDNNFHARHSVKKKEYIYKISLNNKRNENYYYNLSGNLNISNMKKAAKLFVGTYDFKNFVSGERLDYKTTIFSIKIVKIFSNIIIIYKGIGFYRYMVRNLTGALLNVGKNKCTINDINDMLNLKTEKRLPTAPPNGLYLKNIWY